VLDSDGRVVEIKISTMSESRLRLILVGLVCAFLFLGGNSWIAICWNSMEVLAVVTRGFSTSPARDIVLSLGLMPFYLAIPILIVSNIVLALVPGKGLKLVYRIILAILCSAVLYWTFQRDPFVFKGWFLVIPAVTIAAVLLEGFLMMGGGGGEEGSSRDADPEEI
jgi:hypothetical protein